MRTRLLIVTLALVACVALAGCGGSETVGMRAPTEAEKAEQAARDKATADSFKTFQKDQKKASASRKAGHVVNGTRTS